jgi:uncharacterized protein (DUF305 family)
MRPLFIWPNFFSGPGKAWLLAGGLLISSCHGPPEDDQTNGTGVAVPPTGNLDLYFALLIRASHRAAVAMSALELNQGRDPALRRLAETVNHAHQQLIPGLDSAVLRLRALPPTYPEHTTETAHFDQLLTAATAGLVPAAHQTMDRAGAAGSPNLGLREQREDLGTGSLDRDFASLLVPHHQNALKLAQAELSHGQDPALRQAARRILRDQQQEISRAQAWLAQLPKASVPKEAD